MAAKKTNHESRIPPILTDPPGTWQALLPDYPESSSLPNREQINVAAKNLSQKLVPLMLRVVAESRNANDRETAFKTLGLLGGERAVTAMELVCSSPKRDNKADLWLAGLAAARQLRILGFPDTKPGMVENAHTCAVIDPRELQTYFSELQVGIQAVSLSDILSQKYPANLVKISAFSDLQKELSSINLTDVAHIKLTIKNLLFDCSKATELCKKKELSVTNIADNLLKVGGNTWPGFKIINVPLELYFWSDQKAAEVTVIASNIPESSDCVSWVAAVRLLTRLAVWAGKTDSKLNPQIDQQTSTSVTGSLEDDLLQLANDLQH